MPIPAYRAKQSTNTTGTGTIVLAAAETNARSFNAAYGASSRRIMYAISWSTGFEIGLGDFDGGTPGNLTRATVLASSNAGALVTLPAGTKDVFAVFDPAAREVVSISATATLALADLGNAVVFTGSSAATLNLPAVATAPLGAGWLVMNGGTAALTIDPSGAETVNGASTLVLQAGQAAMVLRVASAWQAAALGGTAIGFALMGATSATAAHDLLAAPWVDLASAGTTNIGAANSANVRITGTTTITALGTALSGVTRHLRFAGALTLTHNATSLILPGAANITTAAGDTAIAISLGSGNWVVVNYVPAGGNARAGAATASGLTLATARVLGRVTAGSGAIEEIALGNAAAALSLGINRGTEQATTSGTAIDFTGIPAGVRRITVMLDQVSTNSTSPLTVRLGTSGGIVATGYEGIQGVGDSVPNVFAGISTGFDVYNGAVAEATTGRMVLENQSGNLWLCTFQGFVVQGASRYFSRTSGRVSLSGALTQLRLTTTAGTPTFDQGAINIMWEF
jgi:hypothetical protein